MFGWRQRDIDPRGSGRKPDESLWNRLGQSDLSPSKNRSQLSITSVGVEKVSTNLLIFMKSVWQNGVLGSIV
jgi:hypothetical protein